MTNKCLSILIAWSAWNANFHSPRTPFLFRNFCFCKIIGLFARDSTSGIWIPSNGGLDLWMCFFVVSDACRFREIFSQYHFQRISKYFLHLEYLYESLDSQRNVKNTFQSEKVKKEIGATLRTTLSLSLSLSFFKYFEMKIKEKSAIL